MFHLMGGLEIVLHFWFQCFVSSLYFCLTLSMLEMFVIIPYLWSKLWYRNFPELKTNNLCVVKVQVFIALIECGFYWPLLTLDSENLLWKLLETVYLLAFGSWTRAQSSCTYFFCVFSNFPPNSTRLSMERLWVWLILRSAVAWLWTASIDVCSPSTVVLWPLVSTHPMALV